MHILVLGGNGFIGSHLVASAVDAGHEVTVLDLSPSPRYSHGRPFHFIETATAALPGMKELLSSTDVLCHFAYNSVPSTSNSDPAADVTDNLVSSVRLLETMRTVELRRIVYLSSGGAVYGSPQETPIAEEHPLNPISSYGVTKVAFEKYLRMYATLYGFRPTIIRPSNPYGPGQGKIGLLGVVNTFLSAAATGDTAILWGDGSLVRDFIYIDDLCKLIILALERDEPGIYNCGYGTGTTLSELIVAIESVSGRQIHIQGRPTRDFDPPIIVLDTGRARRTFGWAPGMTLREGLLTTWNWMNTNVVVPTNSAEGTSDII
jgi:UDP-glucose 4-epimerase